MAYVAPSGNAVDFTLSDAAYAIPLGNAVAFEFSDGVPTATLSGSTTLDLRGAAFADGSVNAAASSVAVFENPYRAFQIDGQTSPTFVTWLRHTEIFSGSATAFRSGTKISFASTATVSPQVWGTIQAISGIAGCGAVQFLAIWIHNAACEVVSAGSRVWAKSGYIKPLAFAVRARGEFSPRQTSDAKAEFNSNGRASATLSARKLVLARSDVAADSALSWAGSAKFISNVSVEASCALGFSGQLGALCLVEMPMQSSAVFHGNTIEQDLPTDPDALVYQTSYLKQLHILTSLI